MILKIFIQPNCPKCPPAKNLAKKLVKKSRIRNYELKVETYDTSEVDGLAEGAFYQVMSTPTVLLTNDRGEILGEWRGKAPKKEEILEVMTK